MVGVGSPGRAPFGAPGGDPVPMGVRVVSDLTAAYTGDRVGPLDRSASPDADAAPHDDLTGPQMLHRTPIRQHESPAVNVPPFVSSASTCSTTSSTAAHSILANSTQPSLSAQTSSDAPSHQSSTNQGRAGPSRHRAGRRHAEKHAKVDLEKDIPFFGQAQPILGSPFESPEWMADSHDEVWMEPGSSRPRSSTDSPRKLSDGSRPQVFAASPQGHPSPLRAERANPAARSDAKNEEVGTGLLGFPVSSHLPNTVAGRPRFRIPFAAGGKSVHSAMSRIRPLQIPVLNYAQYQVDPSGGDPEGKRSPSWSLDLFYFLHNAVRYEMRDLYRILYSFYKRASKLRNRDFQDFSTWWVHFRNFVDVILSTESKVLFPWLQTFAVVEGPLSDPNRQTMLSAIAAKMVKVERIKAAVYAKQGDSIAALLTAAAEASQALLKFIDTVEAELKSYNLEVFMQDPGRFQTEIRVRDTLLNSSAPQIYFPLAMRWMRTSPAYDRWSRQLSDKHSKFCLLVWAERYEANHLRLVTDLTRH